MVTSDEGLDESGRELGLGFALGTATGAAGGYIWDRRKRAEESAYERGLEDRREAASSD